MVEARKGVWELCHELDGFIREAESQDTSLRAKQWKILFASGTGTMAYFAHEYFRQHSAAGSKVEIVAIPCVGNETTLKQDLLQLASLESSAISTISLPTILSSSQVHGEKLPTRRFGNIYRIHLDIWNELRKQTAVDFDLIYATRAFELILSHATLRNIKQKGLQLDEMGLKGWEIDCNLLYYHCGGTEGNPSQLARHLYQKKT
jgi:1-aminocyclopropane-1-carboxylate deaminase